MRQGTPSSAAKARARRQADALAELTVAGRRGGGTSRDGEADASKANRPLDQMIACSCKPAIRAAS